MKNTKPRISERHVQAVWYDAALRPNYLTTRQGAPIRVISPGEWNLGAGPDFQNAVLEVGKEQKRVVGSVEVHLCPADWDFHHHGEDPAYRNVIAHVTWGCGPDPKSLPSGAITIWLGRFVLSNPDFDSSAIDLLAYPYAKLPTDQSPCERRLSGNRQDARRILAIAGQHRLRMKARRLMGMMPHRQIFYEEVMAALGYSHNSESFRRVARRVPIDDLPHDVELARSALLTAATFEDWNRCGVRPWNSPERRIEAAARLFSDSPIMDYEKACDFSKSSCRAMISSMTKIGMIGRGRAAAILTNIIIPWALAIGRISELPDWLPPEDISSPIRLMAFRMLGRDHSPAAFYADNGLLIQGLLQIYRDNCQFPDCEACPFGAAGRGVLTTSAA